MKKRDLSRLYVGSCFDIKSVMRNHNRFLPNCYDEHALAHRRAVGKHYTVLCNLSDNAYAQRDKRIRLVIEQLLVILLGTYCTGDLLDRVERVEGQLNQQGISETTASSNFEKEKPEDMDADDGTRDEALRAKLVRHRSLSHWTKVSVTLDKLGHEVCKRCGWQPATDRSDSNGKFGTRIGPLNLFSPIDLKCVDF